LLSTIS